MNIWLVSIFENTPLDDNQNTRYNSLVNEAVERGHKVTFWASTFRHNIKKQRFTELTRKQVNSSVEVVFIPSKPYTKNISAKRMLSHFALGKKMVNHFDEESSKPDVIMLAFPPISIAQSIVKWGKQNGVPVIVDIIDPWPDVFNSQVKSIPNTLGEIALMPLKQKTAYVMKNASGVTAISKQYLDWAGGYNPLLKNTACFYPAVQYDVMREQLIKASKTAEKNGKSFRVIYAGSLGHSYDIKTILKAAEIVEQKSGQAIEFIIAGDGPQKDLVKAYENSRSNLTYLGRIPKEQLMVEYYKADMGMTQHIAGATQSVTYKLFDLLACGLPILNSLESEMKSIILDNEVGLQNDPGDAQQLADNIINCQSNPEMLRGMKESAIRLTEKLGDSKVVYSSALDFIEKTAEL